LLFHCTGEFAISACADKLRREVQAFGNPPIFPEADKKQQPQQPQQVFQKEEEEQQKKSAQASQWAIMQEMHVPDNENQ